METPPMPFPPRSQAALARLASRARRIGEAANPGPADSAAASNMEVDSRMEASCSPQPHCSDVLPRSWLPSRPGLLPRAGALLKPCGRIWTTMLAALWRAPFLQISWLRILCNIAVFAAASWLFAMAAFTLAAAPPLGPSCCPLRSRRSSLRLRSLTSKPFSLRTYPLSGTCPKLRGLPGRSAWPGHCMKLPTSTRWRRGRGCSFCQKLWEGPQGVCVLHSAAMPSVAGRGAGRPLGASSPPPSQSHSCYWVQSDGSGAAPLWRLKVSFRLPALFWWTLRSSAKLRAKSGSGCTAMQGPRRRCCSRWGHSRLLRGRCPARRDPLSLVHPALLTKRHNRLRTLVASWARAAGHHVEVEKPGLFARPHLDVGGGSDFRQHVGNWTRKGRWRWTSLVIRPGCLAGERPAVDYEARKQQHLDTQQLCNVAGLQFLPLVAEACGGGWGPAAQWVWAPWGSEVAVRTGDGAAAETERLLQALSLVAHAAARERASSSPAPPAYREPPARVARPVSSQSCHAWQPASEMGATCFSWPHVFCSPPGASQPTAYHTEPFGTHLCQPRPPEPRHLPGRLVTVTATAASACRPRTSF